MPGSLCVERVLSMWHHAASPRQLWAAVQAKVMEFGVFINIGAPNYGLLHRSQFKVRAKTVP